MPLDPMLLEIIVCPDDKGPLDYIESEQVLLNQRLRRTYAVRDGIPVLLIEESTSLDDSEFSRLSALVSG